MNHTDRTRPTMARILASILTWALVVGQVMQPVHAVLTNLADSAIAAKVAAKPNIVYTLDDSGSMSLNYVPDYVVSTTPAVAVTKITRVGATATVQVASTAALFVGQYVNIVGAVQPEYNGQVQILTLPVGGILFTYAVAGAPVTPATGTITYSVGSAYCRGGSNAAGCTATIQGNNTFTYPPFFTADFNRMMYNPAVTYYPPLKADGTPVTIAGVTDANGNMGTTIALYAAVQRDVYLKMFAAGTKDNLQSRVSVPLYCNTDWPVTAGVNLAITDVGDLQGGPTSGAPLASPVGAYCRINGTVYGASAASGAPATAVAGVEMGYNYPWQSSSGATGAQYFYKQLGNKVLWCDSSSPYWPRNNVIGSCFGGVAVLGGAPTKQTCVKNVDTFSCNPVVASRNFTPVACKTDPAAKYCTPGTGGSGSNTPGTGSLPECLGCTCNNDFLTVGVNGRCSSSGAACNANYGVLGGNLAQCPDVPNGAITSCGVGKPIYNKVTAACTGAPAGVLFDPATNLALIPATTLLQDANTNGVVCRHNNQTYAVSGVPLAGGLFSYPRTSLGDVAAANKTGVPVNGYPFSQTGAFTTQVTGGTCPAVGTTIPIPRHYYTVDSVLFCDNRINTADDQWRGFGTGVCPADGKNDLTLYKNVKYGPFHRWDLYAAAAAPSPIYNPATVYPGGRTWLPASPTPVNSEAVNYANWYAGYATRLNAAKTTSGTAFSYLTPQGADPIGYRVGFHNFGDELPPNGLGLGILWVDVKDWDLAQRTAWYNALYGITVTNFKTPTISAMLRIGNLFEKGGSAGGDAAVNPLPAGALDPIDKDSSGAPISCQNNYHILFTDGYTNQIAPTATAGDRDLNLPPMPPATVVETPPDLVVTNLKGGGLWPKPFLQGAPNLGNTLADVAAYYWGRDLRDGTFGAVLKNDVPSASGANNADLDPSKDVAWWQHVNFSALSFGSAGVLDAANQKTTLAAITAGTQSWPDLTNPNNPVNPKGNGAGAVAVDDLWHATVMGRGSFVYAKSPVEVSYGLAKILAGIQNQRTSRAAAAFGGQVLDAANKIIFQPTIEPGWAGDLLKIEINPLDGSYVQTVWHGTVELAKQIEIPPATPQAQPWMDETKRRVVTLAGNPDPLLGGTIPGPGVAFQYASLSGAPAGGAMLKSLAAGATAAATIEQQKKVIAYLRGGSSFGPPYSANPWTLIEGTDIGQFRQRPSAGQDAVTYAPLTVQLGAGLGDIANAQPLILAHPERNYQDATDPFYSGYKAGQIGRPTVVVAPANDGMVHVFNAGPMPTIAAPGVLPGGGTELFAFMPRGIFRGIAGAAATEDVTAVQALTYQDGGVPIYHHHMYVDSSPRAADVDFGNGTGDWHTIVVGGLGKGGNSYYALDLTDLNVPTEAAAASKVMWEWTNPDSDLLPGQKLVNDGLTSPGGFPGFTYGRPVIVKVRDNPAIYPTGRWVVIVTAGYNNKSGKGKVFFIDAATGKTLSTVTTTAGAPGNPSGLAQIHAFVKNQNNQTAEQIYGGDLLGNVWRIDVSDWADPAKSYMTAPAVLFAELKDKFNIPQPVTTAPQIEIDINNGIDRYVFVGTGRLLHSEDLIIPATPQPQTMYAIRDGSLSTIIPPGPLLPIQPRATMVSIDLMSNGVAAIAGGAPNGWYHDLPSDPAISPEGAQRIVVDPESDVNIASYVGTRVQDDPCIINLPAFFYARDYTSGRSLIDDGSGTGTGLPWHYEAGGISGIQNAAGSSGQLIGLLNLPVSNAGNPPVDPVTLINPVTGPGIRWSWRLLTGE